MERDKSKLRMMKITLIQVPTMLLFVYLKPFDLALMQPVSHADPIQADTASVPSSLSNLVRLAAHLDQNPTDIHENTKLAHMSRHKANNNHGFPTGRPTPSRTFRDEPSKPKPLRREDTFDPGYPEMWEKVSGGSVNLACGSISGEALCLNGESERYVVLAAANTAAGGAVHFGLRMGWDGGAPCDVLLEYKRQGGEWEAMQRFSFMRQAEGNNTELERAADETADSDAATTSVAT
eukprot:gene19529-23355_t